MRRVALAVAALLAASCAGSSSDEIAGVRAVPLDGQISVLRDGEMLALEETIALVTGDVVEAADDGRARIEWDSGQTVELAPGAEVRIGEGALPEVMAGSILARAPAVAVQAGGAHIEGEDAVVRLDRGVSLRLGVYRGEASVPGSGWEGRVDPLKEVFLTAGIVPEPPEPLQVDPEDPWDARFLGGAIDVGLSLEDLQAGLGPQLKGRAPLIRRLLTPQLSKESFRRFVDAIPPAELVVAAEVARAAARDADVSLVDILQRILALRGAGAGWIVVVAEWGVGAGILAGISRIADQIDRLLRPPSPPSQGLTPATPGGVVTGRTTGVPPPPAPTSPPTGGGGDPGNGGGGGPPNDGDPPRDGDPPSPREPKEPTCDDQVECLVEDIVGPTGLP